MNETEVILRVWNALLVMLVALIIGGQYLVMYKYRDVKFSWWAWLPLGLYVFVGLWLVKNDDDYHIQKWFDEHSDETGMQWSKEYIEGLKKATDTTAHQQYNMIGPKVEAIATDIGEGRMGKDIALSGRSATILYFDDPVAAHLPTIPKSLLEASEKWWLEHKGFTKTTPCYDTALSILEGSKKAGVHV